MTAPILVTGGTGKVGTELLRELSARGAPVRALVRSPAKADAVRAAGAEPVSGDFSDRGSLARGLEGVERAFLLSPPSPDQIALQTAFIDAARAAGVRYVVKASVIGADDEAPYSLGRDHRLIERHLEESGMAWTHLRPHSFMQNLLGQAGLVAAKGMLAMPTGEGRVPLIDARDVGTVAAVLLTGSGLEREALTLTGPEALTFGEMAAQLGEAIDRSVRHVDLPPDAARQGMLAMGMPSWLVEDLLILHRMTAEGRAGPVSDATPRITGREGMPFRRFARDYAAQFRGG